MNINYTKKSIRITKKLYLKRPLIINKNPILTLLFLFIFFNYGEAQEIEIIRETKQLVDNRDLYINGGARAQFGGKSRTYIKVDLPENTIQWYYSFSTSKGKSGTNNLNLAIQLAGILADPSGITSKTVSAIDVPEGVASADVYLIDQSNLSPFLKKKSFRHYSEAMAENTKQAIVKIDDIKSGSWYLGIRNPSSLNGLNLSIEVVAITETRIVKEKTDNQEKAELYGNLGWAKFLKGDYEDCIKYCNKSNSIFKLGWVQANKGLAKLMLGKDSEAIEIYIDAITLIKKQPKANYIFKEIIKDINNAILIKPNLIGANDIKQLIELQ